MLGPMSTTQRAGCKAEGNDARAPCGPEAIRALFAGNVPEPRKARGAGGRPQSAHAAGSVGDGARGVVSCGSFTIGAIPARTPAVAFRQWPPFWLLPWRQTA